MNEIIKKGLKNWTKIKLNNLKYYHESIKEEMGRFKYPPHGIKKYSINIFKLSRIKKLLKYSNKLHIGCGGVKIDGFINIDAFKTLATDFVCEIENLPKYIGPNSISMIYSSHILEHFSRREAIEVLKMFYDFLQPGGELRISVPDLIKLADLAKTKSEFKDMETIQGVLMGGQETRYNYHRSIYWFNLLKRILVDIEFRDIGEYPSYPHFLGDVKDASSLAGKPDLGVYISLNIKAMK